MNSENWIFSKKHLIGPFIRIARPEVVEMLGIAGFDFGVVDLEHGSTAQIQDIYSLILAAENKGIKLIARIPGINEMYIKWLLDLGIGGLQIPHISTKKDAELAIKYSKFNPIGERGLCRFVRAAEFSNISKDDYLSNSNSNSLIILQIEGIEGAKNIEDIVSVQGIDVIFIGPYDLSQSMGIPGQIWDDKVINEIKRIIEVCNKNNVATGIFTDTKQGVVNWKKLGVNYINYRIDTEIFLNSAKSILQELE